MARPAATTKASKMTQSIEIVRAVYGDANLDNNEVRKTCIERFKKQLRMQATTASTYLALCQKAIITEQEPEVALRVEAAKKAGREARVFSTFRTGRGDNKHVVTLVGTFLTKEKAIEVNQLLRLPKGNVMKGVITEGQKVVVGA